MALSEERKRKNYEYFKDNWRQVKLSMPNSEAAALEEYCKRHNISKAGFIRDLIKAAISAERESDTHIHGVLCQPSAGGVTPSCNCEEEKRD